MKQLIIFDVSRRRLCDYFKTVNFEIYSNHNKVITVVKSYLVLPILGRPKHRNEVVEYREHVLRKHQL